MITALILVFVHNVQLNVLPVLDVMVLVTLVLPIDLMLQIVTVMMDTMEMTMNVISVLTNWTRFGGLFKITRVTRTFMWRNSVTSTSNTVIRRSRTGLTLDITRITISIILTIIEITRFTVTMWKTSSFFSTFSTDFEVRTS
jgi:hypothetical protein